jgi:3-deoxy-D-arabino-heptulosonate 7-phosphate (DAHP) synthase
MVEVHPNPPEAKSDKEQAQTFDDFTIIVADLDRIPLEHSREMRV